MEKSCVSKCINLNTPIDIKRSIDYNKNKRLLIRINLKICLNSNEVSLN
jgi:hypothetical protein